MNKKFSLYIHIPFCEKKCYYCDFVSCVSTAQNHFDYMQKLFEEIKIKSRYVTKSIDSIFIGGGTPSLLDVELSSRLFEVINSCFKLSSDCEITTEANPNSLSYDKLKSYRALGVNRLSVGVQSIDDNVLNTIGRVHNFDTVKKCVENIHKVGYDNFNLDIMANLPNQNFESYQSSLEFAVDSGAKHISAYSLILEEGTDLESMYEEGLYTYDEELDRLMYGYTKEYLISKGFNRYEVSNYAIDNYACRHNSYCWDFEEYLGVGLNSSSYINQVRFKNISNLKNYLMIEDFIDKKNYDEIEFYNGNELEQDYIMLRLRTSKGIDVKEINSLFKIDFIRKYESIINELKSQNFVSLNSTNLFVTDKGMDFNNYVIEQFI